MSIDGALNNLLSVQLTIDTAVPQVRPGVSLTMTRALTIVDWHYLCLATVGAGTFTLFKREEAISVGTSTCAVVGTWGRAVSIDDTNDQFLVGQGIEIITSAAGVRADITIFIQPDTIPFTPFTT